MIFTESELICFNSIVDGKQIIGLNIENKEEMNSKLNFYQMEQLLQ